MKIIYEIGDSVERLHWVESRALIVTKVHTTGVTVVIETSPDCTRSSDLGYSEEFYTGKFFPFEDIKPCNSTFRNAILLVGDVEVKLAELFDKKYERLLKEKEVESSMELGG